MVEAESYMEELEPESINPVNQPAPFSYGSIPVRQIISNEHRLDVSAFNMNALNALKNVWNHTDGLLSRALQTHLLQKETWHTVLFAVAARRGISETDQIYLA